MKSRFVLRIVAPLAVILMIGCGGGERNQGDAVATGAQTGAQASPPIGGGARELAPVITGDSGLGDAVGASAAAPNSTAPAASGDAIVLFLGTSLTAGQGLSEAQSFPLLIQSRIDSAGLPFSVVNAGVSGETSAGALRRVDWLLQQPFDVLVLETGANDMLRGVDPSATERNIQQIVDRVRDRWPNARIVLTGMMALPNLGPEYGERFAAIYPRLAQRNDLILVPFLLQDVAAERDLNLADGIHPNAAGHRIIAETVWSRLETVLRDALPPDAD